MPLWQKKVLSVDLAHYFADVYFHPEKPPIFFTYCYERRIKMSNHNGITKVQVFISHKTEDKRLAEKIRDKLMILSNSYIRPNLCYEIPGGTQYQEVIEESLRNSNILIFLYTSKETDLKWCLYEAGVFVGSNKSENKHLLCIKGSKIEEPPVTLKNLQAYSADKEGIEKFLQDLLCKDTLTGEKINDTLLIDNKREYEQAIEEIVREFSASELSTKFFSMRASIKFPKALNGEDKIQLDKAIITGKEDTMEILGVSKKASWDDLYELYSNSGNAKWLDEIKEFVEKKCRQIIPNRPLTPFRSITNDIYYMPTVSRVERIQNNPIRICVIFIDTSQIMKEADSAKVPFKLMPPNHKAVTQLISMALTLRWEIIEPYADIFERADEQELKDHCMGLNEALSNMEQQGGGDFTTISLITTFFPVADHQIVRTAINKYIDARKEISNAMDSPNRDGIMKAINNIRWANKVFLKKATEVCSKNLDELEPINMNEN
jgi:hypothetical protein